jgi:hypothetical protein
MGREISAYSANPIGAGRKLPLVMPQHKAAPDGSMPQTLCVPIASSSNPPSRLGRTFNWPPKSSPQQTAVPEGSSAQVMNPEA